MKTCEECKKRSDCVELCDRVEKYISQDYKYQRELTQPEWIMDWFLGTVSTHDVAEVVSYFNEKSVDFPFLSPLQNKILHLFHFEGKTYKEIARALSGNKSKSKINQNAVKWQLQSARKKITSISPTSEGE